MKIDLNEIRKFGNIELLAKQLVEGFITGLHKSPYHGFSVEFAEHRLYNTGESTRHIDWKVYAKTDKLFTKRYEEETNLRCEIVIDSSTSMFYPQENNGKVTFSIMAAAALAYLLQSQRDAVGLSIFSDQINTTLQAKSTRSHLQNIFIELQKLLEAKPEQKKTAVASVLDEIADKLHKRSLVIVFSDMMENVSQREKIFSALQHLKHNKHEVLLFHVVDAKTEEEFEFEERPMEVIDLESGEKIKLQPNQIKEHYVKSIKGFYDDVKLKCAQYKIDFIKADINGGYETVLLPYLIKRTKMR